MRHGVGQKKKTGEQTGAIVWILNGFVFGFVTTIAGVFKQFEDIFVTVCMCLMVMTKFYDMTLKSGGWVT